MLDIAFPADGRMMVRQRHVRRRGDFLDQYVIRIVLATLVFVAHHGHFCLTIRFVQPQVTHPIRFDGEVPLQALAAHGSEVMRTIDRSAGVELTAHPLKKLLDAVAFGIIEILAALEHQVLENMGRTRGPGHLVARTDPIGYLKGNDRRRTVRRQQHVKPIAVQKILIDSLDRFDGSETRRHT